MGKDKIIDSIFLQKYIGKHFLEKIKENGQTVSEVANKLWYSQPYVSRVLSWKDTTLKASKIEEIWKAIWFKSLELEELIKKAKRAEFKESHWEEISSISPADLKVALSREYGINDEAAIEDIKKFLEFIKTKYNDSPR